MLFNSFEDASYLGNSTDEHKSGLGGDEDLKGWIDTLKARPDLVKLDELIASWRGEYFRSS